MSLIKPSNLMLVLAVALAVIASWSLGGRANWLPGVFGVCGLLALLLLVWGTILQAKSKASAAKFVGLRLLALLPWIALSVYVILSIKNPSFEALPPPSIDRFQGPVEHAAHLPTCVSPHRTTQVAMMLGGSIAIGAGVFFLGATLTQIRVLLWCLLGNGLVICVAGIMGKLAGTKKVLGIFPAGQSGSPYDWGFTDQATIPLLKVFGTFRYHNHWGAFCLLTLAVGLALLSWQWLSVKKAQPRGRTFYLLVMAIGVLAVSAFLGGGRATWICFVGIAVLSGVCFAFGPAHGRDKKAARTSWATRLSILVVAVFVVAGGIFLTAGDQIDEQMKKTEIQVRNAKSGRILNIRYYLLQDAAKAGELRPWRGFGLGSAKHIMPMVQDPRAWAYGPGSLRMTFFKPRPVEFAHNDWLQGWMELGAIGMSLFLLPSLFSTVHSIRSGRSNKLSLILAIGIVSICCMAIVEFPFSNPAVLVLFAIVFAASAKFSILYRRKYGAASRSGSSRRSSSGTSSGKRKGRAKRSTSRSRKLIATAE